MFPRYLVRPIFVKRSFNSYSDGPYLDIAGQGVGSGSLVDYTGAVFGRQSRPLRSWGSMNNDFDDEVNILRLFSSGTIL